MMYNIQNISQVYFNTLMKKTFRYGLKLCLLHAHLSSCWQLSWNEKIKLLNLQHLSMQTFHLHTFYV